MAVQPTVLSRASPRRFQQIEVLIDTRLDQLLLVICPQLLLLQWTKSHSQRGESSLWLNHNRNLILNSYYVEQKITSREENYYINASCTYKLLFEHELLLRVTRRRKNHYINSNYMYLYLNFYYMNETISSRGENEWIPNYTITVYEPLNRRLT